MKEVTLEREADLSPELLTLSELDAIRQHENELAECDFILRWVRYGEARTDAPPEFHEAAAHILVATAIDRNRYIDFTHKRVYPSFYGMNLAGSGKRKSTPHAYAQEALAAACSEKLLSNDYSAEALIQDLSVREHARGTALIDEAGRLLGTMKKNNYGEGLKDLLSKLWDCPEAFERRLMKGKYKLSQVYVNLLLATTPSRFLEAATSDDIASGFLPRFLPVVVTREIARRPLTFLTPLVAESGRELTAKLKMMAQQMRGAPRALTITPEAIARLDAAERDLEIWAQQQYHEDLIRPWARRLAEYGARLAIIFSVSEGADKVDRAQVLRALRVTDRARDAVLFVVTEMMKGNGARKRDKVERFIQQNPGISGRDLQRRTSMTALETRECVQELNRQDRVRVKDESHSRYTCWPMVEQEGTPSSCRVSEVSVNSKGLDPRAMDSASIADANDTLTDDIPTPVLTVGASQAVPKEVAEL
jgi:uncharacterized protein DUF3987